MMNMLEKFMDIEKFILKGKVKKNMNILDLFIEGVLGYKLDDVVEYQCLDENDKMYYVEMIDNSKFLFFVSDNNDVDIDTKDFIVVDL